MIIAAATTAGPALQGPPGTFLYDEAFCRNIGLVSPEEQARLRAARVAIAGLGGVGGVHALALARLGIGRFALADFDRFELANFNRQVGATVTSLNRPKVEVMAEAIRAVNPTADLRLFPAGVDESNIDEFLDGAVAAVDGVDFFNMDTRRLLFRRARQHRVPALTAAPIGFGATLHVFTPDGMSFDDYFDLRPGMTLPEQLVQFGLGLAPRLAHLKYFPPSALDLSGRQAPSLGSACLLAAVLVCTEVANLVLRRRPTRAAPYFFQFDPLVQTYRKGRLRWGNRHPVQRLKRWWVLRTNPSLRAAIAAARV
ncbi:MAG TPA: ThiF family adenylyltransferase [Candidatus Binatia bacterium]|nr:ThiF family adenylyltransferase [Candidatus Binatia bacterium]